MSNQVMTARMHLEGLMELKERDVTGRDLAAAALLLADGLAFLAYEWRRPSTPEEAFGLQEDDTTSGDPPVTASPQRCT